MLLVVVLDGDAHHRGDHEVLLLDRRELLRGPDAALVVVMGELQGPQATIDAVVSLD